MLCNDSSEPLARPQAEGAYGQNAKNIFAGCRLVRLSSASPRSPLTYVDFFLDFSCEQPYI